VRPAGCARGREGPALMATVHMGHSHDLETHGDGQRSFVWSFCTKIPAFAKKANIGSQLGRCSVALPRNYARLLKMVYRHPYWGQLATLLDLLHQISNSCKQYDKIIVPPRSLTRTSACLYRLVNCVLPGNRQGFSKITSRLLTNQIPLADE
jgi:hypothetical protein